MSVLTRINRMKSKYATNIGLIQSAQDVYKDLGIKRKTAYGNLVKGQARHKGVIKTYEGFQTEYKDLQTVYGEKEKTFRKTYESELGKDAPLETEEDQLAFQESFYNKQFGVFKETSGARDYFNWRNMMARGSPALALRAAYDRAAQGRADWKQLVTDPMAQYQLDIDELGSYTPKFEEASAKVKGGYKAVEASYEQVESLAGRVSSYDERIATSMERIKSYGASQQQIMGSIEQAEGWLGYDQEARKRGTRRSAQRRTMLTSRSAYA